MKTKRILFAATIFMLASVTVQAQGLRGLGKAVKKAAEAVKETPKPESRPTEPASQPAQQPAQQTRPMTPEEMQDRSKWPPNRTWRSPIGPYVTDEMIAAAAILKERNTKTKPPVWVLAYGAEKGGGATGVMSANQGSLFLNLHLYTPDSIRTIKQQAEARHAENMRLFATFKDTTGFAANENDIKTMRNAKWKPEIVSWAEIDNFPGMADEIERYYLLMDRAQRTAMQYGKFNRAAENQVTMPSIQVGLVHTAYVDGKPVFCRNVQGKEVITPADEELFAAEYAKYQNLVILLRKEPPAEQYPEYAGAQLAAQEITMAQRNAFAMEVKQPIPAPAMNNAALTNKMLKLAQKKYPNWGIVKLVIAESAWRPEKNALGQIIHRRINTKIILPRKSGGYIMRTLSFIEPYAGGKYGEAETFGIGTDETAVAYK